jgi:hypothetical protein
MRSSSSAIMRRLSICFCLAAAFAPPSRVVFSFLTTTPPIIPSRRGGSATVAKTATTTTNSHYYYVSTTTTRDDDKNNYLRRGRRRLLLGLGSLPPNLEALVGDALDEDRKIVVVTGGVLSGIGKGVTASSIGVVSFWRNYIPTLRMAYFD